MTTRDSKTGTANGIGYVVGRLAIWALLSLAVLLLFGMYLLFTEGFSVRFFLISGGAILSAIGIFSYGLVIAQVGRGRKKGFDLTFLTLLGFIPYLFGCYLVFYEGFWRMFLLRNGFSFSVLFTSVIFVVVGYFVVLGIYRVTELGRTVQESTASGETMGSFSTDYLQLDILMHLDVNSGNGVGATRWQHLTAHPKLSNHQARIALVALNYGRALLNNDETRVELFHRVGIAAEGLVRGDRLLSLDPWFLEVAGTKFSIWPWLTDSPDNLREAKVYVARLKGSKGPMGILLLDLKMAWGQERILVPVAALLPLYILAKELDEQGRIRLGETLLAMNRFWGVPERVTMGSEIMAFASALPKLLG
jgi:hypothetical protein